jgi:23S rRNA (cytidine1920-2'-O)/16S rRNA (cytidine1409-2'-O)-methyltransferase
MSKVRIDQLMVQRKLVDSRESAQRLILAKKVKVGDSFAIKAGQLVSEDAKVEILESLKYVSRGGFKLEKALDEFGIDVKGKTLADIGASTGGFTDCLLQRGAAKVYAIDVGYGQFSWRLREDPRVIVKERINARYLKKEDFDLSIVDLAVVDVSFISAHKILEPLAAITNEIVLLLKPQFEAGPDDVPKGGVIRDQKVHRKVLTNFFEQLKDWDVAGLSESPVQGSSGNREFLVHLKRDSAEIAILNSEKLQEKIEQLTS